MTIVDMPEDEPWRPKRRQKTQVQYHDDHRGHPDGHTDLLVYTGRRWRVFGIAFWRMVVTILTLGVGRFWMITRLRRHYWSSIRLGGDPLEYTGTAAEKLIGFLIAVVILATYLMLANLALSFVGLSFFQGNPAALQLPLLALLPLIPWAQYRARRYILSRTRWRGIRFGVAPGAWGYVLQAAIWNTIAALTLGLLKPLAEFKLAKYVADRSFYGHLRFTQEGRWTELFAKWGQYIAVMIVAIIVVSILQAIFLGISIFAAAGADGSDEAANKLLGGYLIAILLSAAAAILVAVFWARYRVFAFRYINSNRVLGGTTRITFELPLSSVIWIYISGFFVIFLVIALCSAAFVAAGFFLLGGDPEAIASLRTGQVEQLWTLALGLVWYLPLIALITACTNAFITHPLIAEACATARVRDLAGADRARQREHDEQSEAGGFADALGADLGGAF